MGIQTKRWSWCESFTNVIIGYIIGVLSQILVFPMVGIDVSFSTNLAIATWFTVISLIRSYIVRRFFNKLN